MNLPPRPAGILLGLLVVYQNRRKEGEPPVVWTWLPMLGMRTLLTHRAYCAKSAVPADPENSDMTQLKLLPAETEIAIMLSPSISTITFCNGDAAGALVWTRRRLAEILLANPWLDGRLRRAEGGETVLLCPTSKPAEEDALPAALFREGGASISRAMPYERVAAAIEAAGLLVKRGRDCIGRDEPLFKVALLLDAEVPSDMFALSFSMSHVLGDGDTFYAVHNMLSKNAPVHPTPFTLQPKASFLNPEL